nr:type IV pilin [uncultured Methanoregula sp.]
MKYSRSEEAVSQVIAVLLVLAAVIILAAVAGVVALGAGGTTGMAKVVAITAQQGSSGITFRVEGGPDLGAVTSLKIMSGNTATYWTNTTPRIGDSYTMSLIRDPRTMVVASFNDGSTQVVFDKTWPRGLGSSAADYATVTASRAGTIITFTCTAVGPKVGDMVSFDITEDGKTIVDDFPSSWFAAGNTGTVGASGSSNHYVMIATLTSGSTVTICDQVV